MKKYLQLILFSSLTIQLNSQVSSGLINFNNVAATVSDGGLLFNDDSLTSPGYEIPIGSGKHAFYSASFWYGAVDATGALRMSATRFDNGSIFFLDQLLMQRLMHHLRT